MLKKEENWDWTVNTLERIRSWFKEEGITVDDAFRVIDRDFDGFIGKEDVQEFLI